jgi:hypothetical protein
MKHLIKSSVWKIYWIDKRGRKHRLNLPIYPGETKESIEECIKLSLLKGQALHSIQSGKALVQNPLIV